MTLLRGPVAAGGPRSVRRRASSPDRATGPGDQPVDEGEPNPSPHALAALRREAVEEDVVERSVRDSRAGVGHGQHEASSVHGEPDDHSPRMCAAVGVVGHRVDGVVDEVAEDGDEQGGPRRPGLEPARPGRAARLTSRSAATVVFASSRAATTGGRSGPGSPRWRGPSRPGASAVAPGLLDLAQVEQPASTCSRLANSCSCARSASVRPRSRRARAQRLELGAVPEGDDAAGVAARRRRTGIRLTTSRCSSVTTTTVGPSTSPVHARPAQPAGGQQVRRRGCPSASASMPQQAARLVVDHVIRPSVSKAITPSRMPCSIASRSCSSAAISPARARRSAASGRGPAGATRRRRGQGERGVEQRSSSTSRRQPRRRPRSRGCRPRPGR